MRLARKLRRWAPHAVLLRDRTQEGLVSCCCAWGAERALALRGWRAVAACPETLAQRFALAQLAAQVSAATPAELGGMAIRFLTTTRTPQTLVAALKVAVTRRPRARRDANALEQHLLREVTREGRWRERFSHGARGRS